MTQPLAAFDRIEPFTVTAQPGTTSTTAVEVVTNFTPGFVIRCELRIPSGHNGLTGISIAQAHQPQFPDRAGAFIVDNNHVLDFNVDDPIGSGQWSCFVFNTSQVAHSWLLRFYVLDAARTRQLQVPAVTPIEFSGI